MTPYLPEPGRILEMLADPVVVLDPNGSILWFNDAALAFAGMDPAEWIGRSVFELLHHDDQAVALAAIDTVVSKDVGNLIDVRIRDGAGRWRHCEIRGKAIEPQHPGGEASIAIVFRDIADRQGLELAAGDANLLRALVHHATALLMTLDPDGLIVTANSELTRLLHHDVSIVKGHEFATLVHPGDRASFREALTDLDSSARLPLRFDRPDGTVAHLDISITDLRADPLIGGYTLSGTDITDLKTTQHALRYMADHDALTGLMSRRALLTQLNGVVDDGFQHEIVVLFCDLDGFKAVNDRIGHAAGDQVLVEVARRIERSIRPGDLVGRLGGDEFVVVLPRADSDVSTEISSRIRDSLIEPIIVGDEVVEVDVSIGAATTGDHPTAARLLATADDAMYAVKHIRQTHSRANLV